MRAVLLTIGLLAVILSAVGCGASRDSKEEFGAIVKEFPVPGAKPGDRLALPLPDGVDEGCAFNRDPSEPRSQGEDVKDNSAHNLE